MLGILGGMGPKASSAFLETIYQYANDREEQAYPACILYSDPSVPDRTEAMCNGNMGLITEKLVVSLTKLHNLDCEQLLMACVSAHAFLKCLPMEIQYKIVSLIDICMLELYRRPGKYIVFCSNGTRHLRVFESHPLWPKLSSRVHMPLEREQEIIQMMIYDLKRTGNASAHINSVTDIVRSHGAHGALMGCTEFHILTKRLLRDPKFKESAVIDPLLLFAREYGRGRWTPPTAPWSDSMSKDENSD